MSQGKIKTVHDHSLRAEIRLYALYRTLEATTLLAFIMFPALYWQELKAPGPAPWIAGLYLLAANSFITLAYTRISAVRQIVAGTVLDIAFISLLLHFAPDITDIAAPMWMLNVAAAALLVSKTFGIATAIAASLSLMFLAAGNWSSQLPYVLIYLAIALVASRLGHRIVRSDQVAQQQELEIAELSSLNSLILERLPVGVLVADGNGRIRNSNQAAKHLLQLDEHPEEEAILDTRSPALARWLGQWRAGKKADQEFLTFPHDDARIEPQFLRLLPQAEETLIFLNDTSQATRRAETMTLATLGRFSASLAHEIRNPLSAINYAAQLLGESKNLDVMDQKMLEIIQQQVQRTNDIINSVLSLAKREAAQPQVFDLGQMVNEFAEEYRAGFPLDTDTLTLRIPGTAVMTSADPCHIHQILMVLISNARYYGRMPEQPAHMTLRVAREANKCVVDVIDQGPGINESAARSLFKPFYTTSSHGTGLGLYIARELAQANAGNLEYLRRNSGSCFRLVIPAAPEEKA